MSELITLPKVTGTFECDKHRTISLISHAAKIALEVIRLRVNHFIAPQIAEEQFGLVSGKGTTDAIIVLRNIIEKAVKRKGAKLWILFVDYAKALDTVNHNALWNTLRVLRPSTFNMVDAETVQQSYWCLRIAGEHTVQFPFEKGVRQGCVLSQMLFNTCGEMIMRMLESEMPERAGCITGGRSVWNLRYADDTTLIARSCNELQQQVSAIENISAQFGLTINATKTHMMVIDAESDADQVIAIAGKAIGRVERFKFLGSIVTNDSNSSTEINVRLAIAGTTWGAFAKTLRISTQALVFPAAEHCAPVWSRSPHVKKVDVAINSSLRTISGCLKPTPVFHLPVLTGIAPAGLRRKAATLALARKAVKDDWHILHDTTKNEVPPCRLKSRKPYNKEAQEMLSVIPEDRSKDAWIAATWKQEWEASGPTRVHRHVSDPE